MLARMDSMLHQTGNSQIFFKVMTGDFRNKLRLPKALNLRYMVNVPKIFSLVSPTGRAWMVAVKRVGDDFYLSSGWTAFAEDYDLEMGEFVLFRDKGRNEYDVKVFGKNAYEKEVSETRVEISMMLKVFGKNACKKEVP